MTFDELSIRYKGEEYHVLCDEIVTETEDGEVYLCIKRMGHLSSTHENWLGEIKPVQIALFKEGES